MSRQIVRSGVLLFFGVALPLAALIVELTLRLNSEVFFDPLPTAFHALLVVSVAATNAWCWFAVNRQKTAQLRWAAVANGVTIGVTSFYTVMFLPLMPLALIGILLWGLGALVWAPVSALIVALRLRSALARLLEGQRIWKRTWSGVALGLAALILLDMPGTITRIGANMATSGTMAKRERGLWLLRTLGSEGVLLRMCYVRSGMTTDMVSFLVDRNGPIDPATARMLYYRVTGQTFNSLPAPVNVYRRGGQLFGGWRFDADQGGSGVGGRVPDLRLESSRLDGSVSAAAALGYLEWTMVFRNESALQHEARAQIGLPPGAVVSRVTLWIDGEEREAAFAGRREVIAAYQTVVRRRQDPVLVTSAGPDRVSMQLFPVPPKGEMKVRIGMTVPLALAGTREGVLRLPFFQERNFDIREALRHSVWIESKSPLHSRLADSGAGGGDGTFRVDIDDAQLASIDTAVIATRNGEERAWSADMRAAGHVVRQVIGYDEGSVRPRRAVIVIDGSLSMREVASELAMTLSGIPEGVDVRLLFAQGDRERAAEVEKLAPAYAAKRIVSFRYAGGQDNVGALTRALALAAEDPDTVLLWIHGPQPVLLETAEPLLQQLSRRPPRGKWYEVQIAPGSNLIAEKLDGVTSIETLRREDLVRIVSAWHSDQPRIVARRERIEADASAQPAGESTSDHLVRLWARDEVTRLIRGGPAHRAEAIELAQRYQLVTPVSGAVVLETQQQYDAAGLQPVSEGTVPTIPEPEEWALIVVALLVLAYAYRRRREWGAARAA